MSYIYARINKETLAYICKGKKTSLQFIVSRTKFKIDKLEKWLNPSDDLLPTINQAKNLASCLHIPFAALYMNPNDIPLPKIPMVKNMRTMIDANNSDNSALNIAMIDLLLERNYLKALQEELKIPRKQHFLPTIPSTDDPILWANEIRSFLGLDLERQYKCTSARQFYLYLRERVEESGIFVHCFSGVPLEEARGCAIFDDDIPIIGLNEDDHAPAKSFSIIHEMVHLYKRESSLCNIMINQSKMHQEEVFCNAVAGELLVPKTSLQIFLKNAHYKKPYELKDFDRLATKFSVSKDVIIRRMLDINVISEYEYHIYSDMLKAELLRVKEEQRIARQEGRKVGFIPEVSRVAFDRTSQSICVALYLGYCENIFSKRDIANHVGINQKHIDKFLLEVSKCIK